jgi:phenylacetate-CoA ligase
MYDWRMELYWRLPVFCQEFALSIYARYLDQLYYGYGYEKWRDECNEWKDWSRFQAEAWQNEELKSIIALAATRVPFYREKWRLVDWRAVRSAEDLKILPLLDKQTIRQNETAFLREGYDPSTLWVEKTSGTTGTSLRIYWPTSVLPKFWAMVEVMVRNIAGVAREMPRAMMGGRPIVAGATSQPPFWRYNRRWKQLYLSSYHVSGSTAAHYADAIRHYGSEWMTGYGSAIAALADFAMKAGVSSNPLRAIVVSGDSLLAGMRTSIETFFQCRCFDHYGQAEGAAMAMECSHGRMHIIPALGIWEIVREDGSPCQPGEVGEIVATGLLNDAMPLIRYRLGDYAAWAGEQSCPCGNQQPIVSDLLGRMDDYLITSDERKIGRLSTAMKRSPTIHSAQIVQDRPGHAFLLIRPGQNYRSVDAISVRDDIVERIGEFDFQIVEVSNLPKTPQGKTALVVRLVDRPYLTEIYDKIVRSTGSPGESCLNGEYQ